MRNTGASPRRNGELVCALLALIVAIAPFAGAAGAQERIGSFEVVIEIDRDGRFLVEERIVYHFDERKHGIFRDIPVRYARRGSADYRIDLDVLSVTDQTGKARPYRVSGQGANQRIRIGDADRWLSGLQEYRISYRVRRAISWFDERDELYWNVTGNEWQVPIGAAAATVFLPPGGGGDAQTICFTGRQGSVETACDHTVSADRIRFAARRSLRPGEGLTFAVSLRKGVLDEPSRSAKALDRASDYVTLATLLPVLVFLGMGGVWWRYGRDPAGPVATPVRYEPPEGMTPAEMGTVIDERADLRDLTATILDLAIRGYLEIEELESTGFLFLKQEDYELREKAPADDSLKAHERQLLADLFKGRSRVKLSQLKNSFYEDLPGIREALYREVTARGRWFPSSPEKLRSRYRWVGLLLLIAGVCIVAFAQRAPEGFSVAACGGAVLFWHRHMPRRTRRGRRARQHIEGFREFVERVEADRLERLGLHTLTQFEKLLPYAFVLGAADAWAEAFADLYREPPSWFHSRRRGSFEPRRFVSDLGESLESAGNAMSSRPRSGGSGASAFGGGGGFSGGGFGGGGGGSW